MRRPIEEAKRLLAEAGYPDGRDAKTGKPLVINFDYQSSPTPGTKALLDWYTKSYSPVVHRDPILSLRGLGKHIWRDERADAYVRRLREGWA